MMKKKNRSAFTLVEVMVVVTILALIAAVGVPSFIKSRTEANKRLRTTNVAAAETAKEEWALLNNKTNGTIVIWDNIENYMGFGINDLEDLDVNGESIVLNEIGTEASYFTETSE